MRTLTIILFACMGTIDKAFGQDNDSTVYINGIPVYNDTVQFFPQIDYLPKENHTMIRAESLPSRLKARLKKDQYKGWEKSPVYLDTNTKTYLITVRRNGNIKVFGLDENGRPLTYDEFDEDGQ